MQAPRPSHEQQLLFNFLKGNPPASLEGANTQLLFDLFRRHRLFPLAVDFLPLLEEKDREKWKKAIHLGSARTLGFVSRLYEIVDRFAGEGIEVLPLKGPVLAQALYGDVIQRHMRDLDLLVQQEEIQRAIGLLQEMGYELKFPVKELTTRQWRTYFSYQYDVGLVHRETKSMLELHSRIAYPGLLGGMELLITGETEAVDLAGRKINSFTKEGSFLYLAVHGAHHLFFRLFWLRDLSQALVRWDMDHKRILNMAGEMGIERILGVGLRLSRYYFNTEIPQEYQALLRKDKNILDRLEARCHRAILNPGFLTRKSRLNVLLFSMAMKKGGRHKWSTLGAVFHRWYIRKFLAR